MRLRVGNSERCVIEYSIVWFTQCLVYIVVLNIDSSILVSARF